MSTPSNYKATNNQSVNTKEITNKNPHKQHLNLQPKQIALYSNHKTTKQANKPQQFYTVNHTRYTNHQP